jgi:predicted transcriptional regulator of viral defense system
MQETIQTKSALEEARRIIREKNGIIRTNQALKAGIHPRTLYELRDRGELEQLSRGVFRLNELAPISNPDLVTIALRIPKAVVCLISALAFHDLTTQVPHDISIALEKGAQSPRIEHPPVTVHRFSKKAFNAGIETHQIDSVDIRIYSPEKTLADCFKFRNKLGMEVVLQALKFYRSRRQFKSDELLKYARVCRMEKVMTPYLEASL